MHPIAPLALVCLCPLAAADVLRVDASGDGDFLAIQPAVDAADDGDTIIVYGVQGVDLERTLYTGFTVTAKSLTIVGEGLPQADVGSSLVRDLAESQVVRLIDIGFNPFGPGANSGSHPSLTEAPGLTVDSCAGSVRVQSCLLGGSIGVRAWAGLQVNSSQDVTLTDVTVQGARVSEADETPGAAIQVVNSRLVAFELTAEGGQGGLTYGQGFPTLGGDGAPGIRLAGRSFLWLGGSVVRGGDGGGGCFYPCNEYPGDGGPGLVVAPASVAFTSETALYGGDAGAWEGGSGAPGAPGVGFEGTVVDSPDTHASIQCSTAARASSPLALEIQGTPGEAVRVALGREGGLRFLGGARGVLCTSDFVDPTGFVDVGTIPMSGVLEVDLPMPPAASGELDSYEVQALLSPAPGAFRLSMTRTVAVPGDGVQLAREGYRRYVDPSAAAGGDGRSWATAFGALQDALNDCMTPTDGVHEIWLKEGRHVPDNEFGYRLPPNVRLLGGFAGQELTSGERDPLAHVTVLDGDRAGDDATGQYGDNTRRVLLHAPSGFSQSFLVSLGGLEIDGLTIRGNTNPTAFAAVYSTGDLVVRQCTIQDTRGRHSIQVADGNLLLERTRIFGHEGSGTAIDMSSFGTPSNRLVIRSSEIYGNRTTTGGPFQWGGAVFCYDIAELDIENTTITGNQCGSGFGGILAVDVPNVRIVNSIVQGNTSPPASPSLSPGISVGSPSSLVVNWNVIEGLDPSFGGAGNLTALVTFVDVDGPDDVPGNGDDNLSLVSGSVGVDAGNSNLVSAGQLRDLRGGFRVKDDPSTADTGVGSPRVVDVGAHER